MCTFVTKLQKSGTIICVFTDKDIVGLVLLKFQKDKLPKSSQATITLYRNMLRETCFSFLYCLIVVGELGVHITNLTVAKMLQLLD